MAARAIGAMKTKLLSSWRRGLVSIALAFTVLAGQGGAVLHELSHYSKSKAQAAAGSETTAPQPGQDKVCDLCLAFAQLAATLHTDPPAATLLADLRRAGTIFRAPGYVAAESPTARGLGPPLFL